MDKLIIDTNGYDVTIRVANGFVSRVVAAVAEASMADARLVAQLLNAAIIEQRKP